MITARERVQRSVFLTAIIIGCAVLVLSLIA
jgi:multisubunit Na+/H+ antiporter MnhC subunit